MKLNKKGVTVIGIIMSFIALLIYVAFLPTILALISTALPYLTGDPMTTMIISLFPLILLLMVIVGTISGGEVREEYR